MTDDWLDGNTRHHCGAFVGTHLLHTGQLICPNHPDFDELEASAT